MQFFDEKEMEKKKRHIFNFANFETEEGRGGRKIYRFFLVNYVYRL